MTATVYAIGTKKPVTPEQEQALLAKATPGRPEITCLPHVVDTETAAEVVAEVVEPVPAATAPTFPDMVPCPPDMERNNPRHPNAALIATSLVDFGVENWTEADYEGFVKAHYTEAEINEKYPAFSVVQPYIRLALLRKNLTH